MKSGFMAWVREEIARKDEEIRKLSARIQKDSRPCPPCEHLDEKMEQIVALEATVKEKDEEIKELDNDLQKQFNYEQSEVEYMEQIATLTEWHEDVKRITKEISDFLHPDGRGPESPSLCDVQAYIRHDIAVLTAENKRLKEREASLIKRLQAHGDIETDKEEAEG